MTQLRMNLKMDTEDTAKAERVAKAKAKKVEADFQPTWEQVWYTGYGKKKGIFQMSLSAGDKEKLQKVMESVECGEIGAEVDNMKKFSKSHALNLYKILMETRKDSIIAKMIAEKPANYHMINTEIEFNIMLELLKEETIIGLDTETDGLDYDKNHIVGISMTLPKADYHCYIPVRHIETPVVQLDADWVFAQLKPFMEDDKLGKVLHNAKFDFHMFWREGIYVRGLVMDTIVAMRVLNENEMSYALKNLATKYGKYFGFEDKSSTYEELFGKCGFERTPLDIGTVYACKDTHLCYEFYLWVDSQFKRLPKLGKIYYEIELPNTIVAFDMEKNGLLVDLGFAQGYTNILAEEVKALEDTLAEAFGDINLNSNDQLAKVIYDDWGLEDISKHRSVDADTIKLLSHQNKNLKILLEYRGKTKLLTTYFEALPQKIWDRDSRLHGSFNQNGTKTGRYSSNDPNMQNIPPKARPMFIAPVNKIIIGKDLSQIEPRCLAYMSDDKNFQESYLLGKDLYSTLASRTFKLDMEYCLDGAYDPTHTYAPRKRMKTGLLAVMYGTSIFTLSQQLDITAEEAETFIEEFLEAFPETKAYIQGIKDFVDKNGYVETFLGRKRRFPQHVELAKRYHAICDKIKSVNNGVVPSNIWQSKLSYNLKMEYWKYASAYGRVTRQAVNFVIQGSSADYIKMVMLRVNDYLKTLGDDYKMVSSIHDEILMEVPYDIPQSVIDELDRIMTNIDWFDFPVKTDTVVMKKWGQEIHVSEYMANKDKYIAEWVAEGK